MKIKTKVYLIIILSLLLVTALTYLFNRSEQVPVINKNNNSNYLEYKKVNEFVYQEAEKVYLFFYDNDDSNSNVVLEYLDLIKKTYKIDSFEKLYFVDITDVNDSSYTKTNWGFYNCPTFLCMSISNSEVQITNKLEWQIDLPYTKEEIESWLISNKIIN